MDIVKLRLGRLFSCNILHNKESIKPPHNIEPEVELCQEAVEKINKVDQIKEKIEEDDNDKVMLINQLIEKEIKQENEPICNLIEEPMLPLVKPVKKTKSD